MGDNGLVNDAAEQIQVSSTGLTFEQVVERFGPALARLAASHEFDRAVCEELYQEILLAVWRALPRLDDPARLRAYVFRIAHNRAVSHIADQVRRGSTLPLAMEPADHASDPSRVAESEERRQQLLQAVRGLPLGQRQAVSLFFEGLTHAEIGEVLGITENNVAVRINRARRSLTETL